jgi:hypothetical protein
MNLGRRVLDVFRGAMVSRAAGGSGRKRGQSRLQRHRGNRGGFEQLEQRDLLSAVTILSEGFEHGAPVRNGWLAGDGNWVGKAAYWKDVGASFGGEGTHGGSYKGYCAGVGNAGTSANPKYRDSMGAFMTRTIDLSGLSSASLSFWYKMPSVEAGKYDHLRVYVDAKMVLDVSSAVRSWTNKSVDLGDYIGGKHVLTFAFDSDRSGVAEGAYLDDILVTGVSGPTNDNFARRAAICGMTATATGTNVDATKQSGEPNHAGNTGGKSVWWKWTAPYDCSVQIDTIGSAFDTLLGVYTGSSVSALTSVASDDNSGGSGTSKATFSAKAGTCYLIAVDGFDGAAGSIALHVAGSLTADQYEPDDTAEQASTIGIDGATQTHNIGTTTDVDWATFTIDQSSPVVIETRGAAGGDTRMWLYGPDSSTTELAYDDNSGIGCYSRIVSAGLDSGTYHLKVDGDNAVISQYTLSVTALEEADVFLTRSDTALLSVAIRTAEAKELKVAYGNTYSHSAMYVGSGLVAEMLGTGYKETGLVAWFKGEEYVDIYRNNRLGDLGDEVAAAARAYAGTPYAYYQIGVLGVQALSPYVVIPIITEKAWSLYRAHDVGSQRMICSELVARAFADVGGAATLDVTLWPSMQSKDTSLDFHWDFTTPTVLSLSPDLTRLNV